MNKLENKQAVLSSMSNDTEVMDFYQVLDDLGLQSMLRVIDYVPPAYVGLEGVLSYLKDIVLNNKKTFIYGDYDVDGLMCLRTMNDGLRKCGATDLTMYHYRSRTHALDKVAVQKCLQGGYEYFIVCDTGSSSLDDLQLLANNNVKVVVLDHHNTMFSYDNLPDTVKMINTTIENDLMLQDSEDSVTPACELYTLSAGALCYTVIDALIRELNLKVDDSLSAFATISLFADCMDMRSELNRAIYFRAKALEREELPRSVRIFMNQYSAFNARFINFWFSPKVNAAFRSENLELLNTLFLNPDIDAVVEAKTLDELIEVYTKARSLVDKTVDVIEVTEMKHFVFADLYSVNRYIDVKSNKLYNYTGLVANMLSSTYEKTAVVVCRMDNEYKGSVRDLYGRNYLNVFHTMCYAGGHGAAFGIRIRIFEYTNFKNALHHLDEHFAIRHIENKPIIISYPYSEPDEALITDIATYDEFTGPNVPMILLRKMIIGDMREMKNKWNYKYKWGDFFIQSDYQLHFRSNVLLKPTHTASVRLLVQ